MKIDKPLVKELVNLRRTSNFRGIRKKIGEDRLRIFFMNLYPQFSLNEIEMITGIPDSTLGYWFRELKIPLIRNHITNVSVPGGSDSEIIITKGGKAQRVYAVSINTSLAYTIGFALGDGSVQPYMVEVFNKDQKLHDYFLNVLPVYGSVTQDKTASGLWRLRLSSGKIANLIKNEGGIRRDVIDFIFKNDTLASHFLAGLWDAEGTVHKGRYSYYHLYFFNSNPYLIRKLCGFLKKKDIAYSLRTSEPTVRTIKGKTLTAKLPVHRVSIPKKDSYRWVLEIGQYLKHSQKSILAQEILLSGGNKKWQKQ